LGGNDKILNLWPQKRNSYWSPEKKKKLAEQLLYAVCRGQLTLKEAQEAIAKNWIEAYIKYVKNAE
jgi:hypothetical protein